VFWSVAEIGFVLSERRIKGNVGCGWWGFWGFWFGFIAGIWWVFDFGLEMGGWIWGFLRKNKDVRVVQTNVCVKSYLE
jgi:hypothetical protein